MAAVGYKIFPLPLASLCISVSLLFVVIESDEGPASGIGFHQDGPLFLPRGAIVTLGAPAVIQFVDPDDSALGSKHTVYLRPRSLFVFEGEAYTKLKHGKLGHESEEREREREEKRRVGLLNPNLFLVCL